VVKIERILANVGTCSACDDAVAFVQPPDWKKMLKLDPTPREFGQWIILPNGVSALSLVDEEVQRLLGENCMSEYHELPRYVAHDTVCRMAGFRSLNSATRNATGSRWQSEQREARRRQMLEADRLRN
jgi:hypothetical protein